MSVPNQDKILALDGGQFIVDALEQLRAEIYQHPTTNVLGHHIMIKEDADARVATGEVPGLKVTLGTLGSSTNPAQGDAVAVAGHVQSTPNRKRVWGANFIASAIGTDALAVGTEIDCNSNVGDGPDAGGSLSKYGAWSVSGGLKKATAAFISSSTNSPTNNWRYGAFLDAIGGISPSAAIKTGGAVNAEYGLDFISSTYSLAAMRLLEGHAIAWAAGGAPGTLTSFVTNGQFKFPGTQNASADANTLDDYEEGNWTLIDSSGAGLAFTVNSATYVKMGQLVMANFDIVYPATASGLNAVVGGLPFTIANTGFNSHGGFVSYTNLAATPMLLAIANNTIFVIYQVGGAAQYTNVQMSTASLRGTIIYRATA